MSKRNGAGDPAAVPREGQCPPPCTPQPAKSAAVSSRPAITPGRLPDSMLKCMRACLKDQEQAAVPASSASSALEAASKELEGAASLPLGAASKAASGPATTPSTAGPVLAPPGSAFHSARDPTALSAPLAVTPASPPSPLLGTTSPCGLPGETAARPAGSPGQEAPQEAAQEAVQVQAPGAGLLCVDACEGDPRSPSSRSCELVRPAAGDGIQASGGRAPAARSLPGGVRVGHDLPSREAPCSASPATGLQEPVDTSSSSDVDVASKAQELLARLFADLEGMVARLQRDLDLEDVDELIEETGRMGDLLEGLLLTGTSAGVDLGDLRSFEAFIEVFTEVNRHLLSMLEQDYESAQRKRASARRGCSKLVGMLQGLGGEGLQLEHLEDQPGEVWTPADVPGGRLEKIRDSMSLVKHRQGALERTVSPCAE